MILIQIKPHLQEPRQTEIIKSMSTAVKQRIGVNWQSQPMLKKEDPVKIAEVEWIAEAA